MMEIRLKSKLQKITTFLFDVDGVMTNATVISLRGNELARVFNVRDGYAMATAVRAGYRIFVISGGKEESIRERLTGLGIKDIFLSVPTDKKLEVFDNYLAENGISAEEVLFMGDDLPDWEIMSRREVLATCPADAVDEIKEVVVYETNKTGGNGAVREVIELVMKAQNKWMKFL